MRTILIVGAVVLILLTLGISSLVAIARECLEVEEPLAERTDSKSWYHEWPSLREFRRALFRRCAGSPETQSRQSRSQHLTQR